MIISWDEHFRESETSAGSWRVSALMLKRSSDLLYQAYLADLERLQRERQPDIENLGVVGPATTLLGLAFENCLKALIVRSIPADERPRWPGDGHDLLRLLDATSLSCTLAESFLLRRLSEFVRWAGRYPVPRQPEMITLQQAPYSEPTKPFPLLPREKSMSDALFERLNAIIVAEPVHGESTVQHSDDALDE